MNVDQYQRWKDDPLTVLFHQFLKDKRQELMEQWAEGEHCTPSAEGTAVLNASAIARAQCLLELVELKDSYISDFYRQTKGSEHVPEDQAVG